MKVKRFEGMSSCYLIQGKQNVLIDAGADVHDRVDIVILTHSHFDHIAYLHHIVKRNKCKVYVSEKEKQDIETISEKTMYRWSPIQLEPVKVHKTLKEGDLLKFDGFSLRVIESPGHTDGSISLYNEDTCELFSGDTVFNFNGVFGRTDCPSGSHKDLFCSIDKLKSLKIKNLYPGHDY